MDCWWPNRVHAVKIQLQMLQENHPRHSMARNEEPPPVLVLRPRSVGLRGSWPPCTDARKFHASRCCSALWRISPAPWLASRRGSLGNAADHRPLLGLVQPGPHGCGLHRRLCTDRAEIISPKEAHGVACWRMRTRGIRPVLRLDQHCGLATGHGIHTGRQWLAGIPERWCTVLAKCHSRRRSFFWCAVCRLGRCRTYQPLAPFVDPPRTHSPRRPFGLNWLQQLRPTVGHDSARKRLPSLRANHSVA